eukprot:9494326-Pyramimonas_sp.AAC.2
MFSGFSAARKDHKAEARKEAQVCQRILPAPAKPPLSYDQVFRDNAVDHVQTVLEAGAFISIGETPPGERPSLVNMKAALLRVPTAPREACVLEPDMDGIGG